MFNKKILLLFQSQFSKIVKIIKGQFWSVEKTLPKNKKKKRDHAMPFFLAASL
jgi:hypothetical protein